MAPRLLLVDWLRGGRRGQRLIDLGLAPGSRLPLYATAAGKLLLANLPDQDQRERMAELQLTKHAPNTIKSKTALRQELAQVPRGEPRRRRGGARAPTCTRSPPRFAPAGSEVVAAATMTAHSSMIAMEEFVDALGPHLISTADRISARLGYRRDDERVGG